MLTRFKVVAVVAVLAASVSSAALARGDEVVRTKYTTQAANTSQAQQALAKLRAQEAAILKQMADIYKSMAKGEKAAK